MARIADWSWEAHVPGVATLRRRTLVAAMRVSLRGAVESRRPSREMRLIVLQRGAGCVRSLPLVSGRTLACKVVS